LKIQDLDLLRGYADQPVVIGRPSKNQGIGFMKIPKGLEDNEFSATRIQGLPVAKMIDGKYQYGRISSLYTNRDMVIIYQVTYIGTDISDEFLLQEALKANQLYRFRMKQGEIEDKISYVNASTSI
jgi:hypothetical protein